jgi:hypothetical protein
MARKRRRKIDAAALIYMKIQWKRGTDPFQRNNLLRRFRSIQRVGDIMVPAVVILK